MSSIDQFLKTGRLGWLGPSMDRQAVRTLLGEPDETSRGKRFELWKYGALQIGFHRDSAGGKPVLTTLHVDCRDPEETLPERLGLTGPMPSTSWSIEQFRPYLDERNPEGSPTLDATESGPVRLASGVEVNFDEGRLDGIHYHFPVVIERKQLTLFLKTDALDVIREESIRRGMPIAELCALLIEERVELDQQAPTPVPSTRFDRPKRGLEFNLPREGSDV